MSDRRSTRNQSAVGGAALADQVDRSATLYRDDDGAPRSVAAVLAYVRLPRTIATRVVAEFDGSADLSSSQLAID